MKAGGRATGHVVTMSEIFKSHEECENPRSSLIEGKPGMGKTTYCKKLVYGWAIGKQETGGFLPSFKIVLFIKCRDMKGDLWAAIDDQLLPRGIDEAEKEKFFNFIRRNQSAVLLVLDGLDEVSVSKLPMFAEIIQGRLLPSVTWLLQRDTKLEFKLEDIVTHCWRLKGSLKRMRETLSPSTSKQGRIWPKLSSKRLEKIKS